MTNKILFIVPPCSEHDTNKGKTDLDKKKKELRVYPYLGVGYLISSLNHNKRLDYEVNLIDSPAENLSINELVEKAAQINPKVICITLTTFAIRIGHIMINELKEKLPQVKIILGGVHINHSSQDFKYFNADYGLRGDCEFTIKKLVEGILENTNVKEIPGVMYKENGELVMNEPAIIEDLDSIQFPDRSLLKPENYLFPLFNKKFTTIISSRGCPYKCIYCGLPYNRKYKKRSVDNVMQEVKEIQNLGFEFVSFSDDIFTMDRDRVLEICKRMKQDNINIKWGCSTRADRVDYELLKTMYDAGCIDIRFGVESGNERVRNKIIQKGVSDQTIINAVKWAKKAGLVTTGFFLFGQPTETVEEMKETVEFAKKVNFDFANFSIVVPIPSSGTFEAGIKEGKFDSNLWRDIIQGKKEIPFYTPDGVTIEEMQKIRHYANRNFYLRPKYILSQIASIKNPKDFVMRFKSGVNLLFYRGRDD
jgi:anaerobic magnesium-protoporphyrin IX monomethyl ester cyclase